MRLLHVIDSILTFILHILRLKIDQNQERMGINLCSFLYYRRSSNSSLMMTETNDNIVDRDALQEAYIESIIDGMDHKSLWQFVYDSLNGNLDDYTVDELITEVKDYYPELLEQDGVSVTYGDKLQESS